MLVEMATDELYVWCREWGEGRGGGGGVACKFLSKKQRGGI